MTLNRYVVHLLSGRGVPLCGECFRRATTGNAIGDYGTSQFAGLMRARKIA